LGNNTVGVPTAQWVAATGAMVKPIGDTWSGVPLPSPLSTTTRTAVGRTNPEIAAQLGISLFTARNHAEQIFVRLKVESRWQVARALCDAVAAGAG
jgi:hypothetical protein